MGNAIEVHEFVLFQQLSSEENNIEKAHINKFSPSCDLNLYSLFKSRNQCLKTKIQNRMSNSHKRKQVKAFCASYIVSYCSERYEGVIRVSKISIYYGLGVLIICSYLRYVKYTLFTCL